MPILSTDVFKREGGFMEEERKREREKEHVSVFLQTHVGVAGRDQYWLSSIAPHQPHLLETGSLPKLELAALARLGGL